MRNWRLYRLEKAVENLTAKATSGSSGNQDQSMENLDRIIAEFEEKDRELLAQIGPEAFAVHQAEQEAENRELDEAASKVEINQRWHARGFNWSTLTPVEQRALSNHIIACLGANISPESTQAELAKHLATPVLVGNGHFDEN